MEPLAGRVIVYSYNWSEVFERLKEKRINTPTKNISEYFENREPGAFYMLYWVWKEMDRIIKRREALHEVRQELYNEMSNQGHDHNRTFAEITSKIGVYIQSYRQLEKDYDKYIRIAAKSVSIIKTVWMHVISSPKYQMWHRRINYWDQGKKPPRIVLSDGQKASTEPVSKKRKICE